MKYLNRTEIIALILDSTNGGTTWTKIMYKTFVSYHQLKKYLSILIDLISESVLMETKHSKLLKKA
jgi:predicted transcriptional regulator